MNQDPLYILKNEIQEKKKASELAIQKLNDRKLELQNQIKEFKKKHEISIQSLKDVHEFQKDSLSQQNNKEVYSLKREFGQINDKKTNKNVANELIEHDTFKEEMDEIQSKINEINNDTEKFIEEKKELYQILLLPFQDSIEFDKAQIKEIKEKINSLQDTKLVINKVDKCRRGPKRTHLDRFISDAENNIESMNLDFNYQIDKLDKSYARRKEVMEYEISKLRKALKIATSKKASFQTKVDELKRTHANKMNELKFTIFSLEPSNSTIPTPSIDRTEKIESKKNTNAEMSMVLEERKQLLIKLKHKKMDLIRKIRKMNWVLSNPTDVAYSRASSSQTTIESRYLNS